MELSEKYPEEYFNHWIAMLSTMNNDLTESGIKEQIENYKNFEGEQEFSELQLELKTIIDNGDLNDFVEVANNHGLEKIQTKDLINMAELIMAE
ncbi:hypothetical protein ACFSTE_22435 [Aquimarina hainanensis]|uniref:Uncharacterized protein n=1 Tax=Aquimarina hainanensis TaxID=1578017 RepID=A0ABW5NGD0_9FLAO